MKADDAKAALRAQMRAARRDFARQAPRIDPPPAFSARLEAGRRLIVASYAPMANEADPALLHDAAVAHGHAIALPHITDRHAPMRFLGWTPGDPLVPGPHGLRQPRDDAPALTPDIILTPLVAFDARGNRLGQGAGYYDRAFATLPKALRIGVAWAMQQRDSVPAERWDMPLHAVITEHGWMEIERR